MYVDDMVLDSLNKEDLQTALNNFQKWAEENDFKINKNKSALMIFRRGGRVSASDRLMLGNEPLNMVKKYKYLGLTMQTTSSSFSEQIQESASAAIRAICNIKNLTSLKLTTAMRLFDTVITPIATYGLDLIWDKLTINDMERIENIKARFIKRAIAAGKYAPNRMIHLLVRETFFLEDLRIKMQLPSNAAYKETLPRRERKQAK